MAFVRFHGSLRSGNRTQAEHTVISRVSFVFFFPRPTFLGPSKQPEKSDMEEKEIKFHPITFDRIEKNRKPRRETSACGFVTSLCVAAAQNG